MKCGPEVKLGSKLLADVEQLKKTGKAAST